MEEIKLEFQQYYARILCLEDVSETYLSWLNDQDVIEFLEVKFVHYTLDELKAYVQSFVDTEGKFLFGIFDKENDNHVGNATIYNIDQNRGTFDIGYLIGEKEYWGKDASTAALLMMLKYSFEALGLRKIFGEIFSSHVKARFTSKKAGFMEEARLKETGYFNGKLCDTIVYTMNRDQWLNVKKKFKI